MSQVASNSTELFAQVMDPANRANPYPLYERLRATPVARLDDGFYAVSTYPEIAALLHDPRAGKDQRKSEVSVGARGVSPTPPFLFLDPPEHDHLRALVMHQFTPERVNAMHNRIVGIVNELLDARRDSQELDVVDDLAYPLPVTVICEMLGVPREDEGRFHEWADILAHSLDPEPGEDMEAEALRARQEITPYMLDLVQKRREHPEDDLISALAVNNDPEGRMDDANLITTLVLLLIAGHETTVNLITNSSLTLLRNPEELARLHEQPERIIRVVEEVLRYEPPVQFAQRYALADIEIAGTTIPKGAGIRLIFGSGNRDPQQFVNPDHFDPDRPDNQHFGFGGAVHYCVGAPLARIEAQIALTALFHRLVQPRLKVDPPPYRPNAVLRGPRHLPVTFERMQS
ncbi:cytochrome P450 [Dictyobacter alpinus]|uniref:Cytochrome P450 n=1 Tax=Dictyobacter alpinus TaxID=2014873 RepID=A0A402BC85_9CHLR|nr:cytochrome P450 [Dictyobacter alpinus]GCE28902.1 cytochrome P450 [Dictyobacter alpinus]